MKVGRARFKVRVVLRQKRRKNAAIQNLADIRGQPIPTQF